MKRRVGLLAVAVGVALVTTAQAQAATFDVSVGPSHAPALKAD